MFVFINIVDTILASRVTRFQNYVNDSSWQHGTGDFFKTTPSTKGLRTFNRHCTVKCHGVLRMREHCRMANLLVDHDSRPNGELTKSVVSHASS